MDVSDYARAFEIYTQRVVTFGPGHSSTLEAARYLQSIDYLKEVWFDYVRNR